MAKLRRTIGRPATAKKAAAKPAMKAKSATKARAAVKARPPVKAKPAKKARAAIKAKPAARAVRKASVSTHRSAPPPKGRAKSTPRSGKPLAPPKPMPRSTYAEAVLTYERAMQALQAKRYRDAALLLKTVITTYPEEKELLERAQVYLRVCERHLTPLDATPSTPEERVYAATLAINAGDMERAVALLASAVAQDPTNDHAEYMLGVAMAIRGNADAATSHLERAVALNPDTRSLIAKEADLEALRHTDAIVALLSAPAAPAPSRKGRDARPSGRARGSAR